MANHKSAAKRARQNEKRSVNNKSQLARVRTLIKNLNKAIEGKDTQKSKDLLKETQSALGKLAQKGIIKKKNAGRKTSRLFQKLNAKKNA